MPPYLTQIEVWKSIWPIILVVFLLAAIISMFECKKEQRIELFLVVLAFSILGMVTGYLTGFSRESAVGAVLPAVLSLMGGLMIFLVGKSKESRAIVSISMIVFSFTLLLGTGWGAVMRSTAEEFKKSEAYLKKQSFIESEVNEFRKKLDLPPIENKDATKEKRPK